ncbi:snoRNA-binding protein [Pestalotiopsis sp. 9143b]|nr:snoRNA-binding protein [Pestalotiopsis sp. 9143b]
MGSTKPEKKEKKDKSAKRSEADGVSKSSKVKGDKKEKKDKKDKLKSAVLNAALDDKLQADAAAQSLDKAPEVTEVEAEDDDGEKTTKHVVGALVPFARPLAEDKGTKKILKSVRKAAKNKTLKRGVKEVVKALRKSPASGPTNQSFPGVVVLAGDISPMDVISHIPVLCEDVNSRAELGAAGSTKRPTSVVMVTEKRTGGKKGEKEEAVDEDFAEVYKDLVKLVQKEAKQLKFT